MAILTWSGLRLEAAVYFVTSKANSGAGTLRQAILDANANAGHDTIQFNITGGTPYNITPTEALPAITDPVLIDGTTQPGWVGEPLVGVVGSSAGNVNGLVIQTIGCEIRALAINRFQGNGIQIQGHSNIVAGCFLGTTLAGTARAANDGAGVTIVQGAWNRIGGTAAADRNVISGNGTGLYIVGLLATNNRICGNYIGPDATGASDLGNDENGVLLSAPLNVVGGTSAAERNVISGNGQSGVYLNDLGATANRVLGNFIGLRVNGTTAMSNGADGITIYQAKQNIIGGTEPGAGNVISGNNQRGLLIVGANAVSNRVEGNLVGTDATGQAELGNRFSGVSLVAARTNFVGATNGLGRNVIAGNRQSGLSIESNSLANVVCGNFIGLDATGTNALPNLWNGVTVLGGTNNVIGGVAGTGNVISGNTQNGVMLAGGTGTQVRGNLIGTDATGRNARANLFAGVRIDAAGNVVGGESPLARNVISGNGNSGVYLFGAGCTSNVVAGNWIGTDATGTARLGNAFHGVSLTNAQRNFVGTSDPFGGNVISGNASSGVYLIGATTTANWVRNNWIGPDATGSNALANTVGGVTLIRAHGNFIGGSEIGGGNVISGNLDVTVYLNGANSNVIRGNIIGLRADGTTPMPNVLHGIEFLSGASANVVGGTVPGEGNRIAYAQGAGYDGIRIRDGCLGNRIRGNAIFGNSTTAAGLGIDWSNDGVTTTNAVRFPTLNSASGEHITTINGSLTGWPNASYTIDFYINPSAEPSGYGEGQRWLGETTIAIGPGGTASFALVLTNAAGAKGFLSATTTDASGTTSEFAAIAAVMPAGDSDGDGLPDDYELAFGLNPNSNTDGLVDRDLDGATNLGEFRAGTRANDGTSAPRMSLVPEPGRTLVFIESVDGRTYRVEAATEVTGPWTILGDNLAGTGTRLRVTDPTAASRKFYRARVN